MKNNIHLIGNAHIDPVWLWRWQEGYAEIKASFLSALDRIMEYPGFIFTSACAAYYEWVEQNSPKMFEEIKKRISEGRWVIAGGWWIQPDCNIPNTESFARHALYSQRYFYESFGHIAKAGYCVDSFGHSGGLPQLLKQSGLDWYVFMRPDKIENPQMPIGSFFWHGTDDSKILAYRIPTTYGSWWEDMTSDEHVECRKLVETVRLRDELERDLMAFFGVGNHGGGPTITNLNIFKEMMEKDDSLIFSSPNTFFSSIKDKNQPEFKGELLHHASGCYSAHSKIKKDNRRAENRLVTAEKMSVLAHSLTGLNYPGKELSVAWKNTLFNQFHDIICGCSLKEAYEDAAELHYEALSIAAKALNAAIQKISWEIDTTFGVNPMRTREDDNRTWDANELGAPLVVFNPFTWQAKLPVIVNAEASAIQTHDGNRVVSQRVRGPQTNNADKWNTLFVAEVPPMGYRLYRLHMKKTFDDLSSETITATENVLENNWLRLEIDRDSGYIKSLRDLKSGKEVFDGFAAVPVLIDIGYCDTWAHMVFSFRDEVGRFAGSKITLLEEGPIRARLRVEQTYNNSAITQDYMLYADKPQLFVKVKLDFGEPYKMLKLSFPVGISDKATYEVPGGFIERTRDDLEQPGQRWLRVAGEDGFSFALVNDCKYSFESSENDVSMTIANSSSYADHYGQDYRDIYNENLDIGIQEFNYALHISSDLPGVIRTACELNTEVTHIMETYHEGDLPELFSGINISDPNVFCSALKLSADGMGIVLRLQNLSNQKIDCGVELPFIIRKWRASFDKQQIKTFYIPNDKKADIREIDFTELYTDIT